MRVCTGITLAGFALAALSQAQSQEKDQAGAEAQCRAAIIGYASNVQAFPFYRCRYRTTLAEAASIEDALARKWVNARSAEDLLIVEDDYERFERNGTSLPTKAEKKIAPKVMKGGVGYVPSDGLSSRKFLRGIPGRLSYNPILQTMNLYSRTTAMSGLAVSTPLDMGCLGYRNEKGPDRLLADTADYQPTFLGREVVNGVSAIGTRFLKKSVGEVFEFWLDGSRGFLPVRCNFTTTDGRVVQYHLLGARECSNGRWFPDRVLSITPPKEKSGTFHLRETQVLELDADHRPGTAVFTISVPAGTGLKWYDKPGPNVRLKQDESINVLDLPELFDKAEKASSSPLIDTGLSHQRSWPWMWIGLVGGSLCVATGIFLLVWRRRTPGLSIPRG